ncbi:hypothetical protein A3K64_04240 [Candidatus Micrarchaeota archaeon RBG_16_36_9]|nr:MAG: hypothetical protein A3K64_04240 [Candidatus Micrarchaeota archaeon RBG_16_36_9]
MVFGWLKRFKKEEKEEDVFPSEVTSPLPDDLERFRVREPDILPMPPMDMATEKTEKATDNKDKLDLILQKLETIDVRLKLLEEKLGV